MEVMEKVTRAYLKIFARDSNLLGNEVNERSITHRFAMYIQDEFPEYNVDCEYNRNGDIPKRLRSFRTRVNSDDADGKTVYPDIIVHHRGTTNNLIVIEAKKSTNPSNHRNRRGCKCDECKLRAYKTDLSYQYAFFVIFPVGNDLRTFGNTSIGGCIRLIQ